MKKRKCLQWVQEQLHQAAKTGKGTAQTPTQDCFGARKLLILSIHFSLICQGADSLADFLNFTEKEVELFETDSVLPLAKKDKKKAKNSLKFAKHLQKKDKDCNWFALVTDDFDKLLVEVAPNTNNKGSIFKGNDVSRFQANTKLDMKSYLLFNGEWGHWVSRTETNPERNCVLHFIISIFPK